MRYKMSKIKNKSYLYEIFTHLTLLSLALFLYRMALPYLSWPFVAFFILTLIFFCYLFLKNFVQGRNDIQIYLRASLPFIIIASFFLVNLFLQGPIIKELAIESVNVFIVFGYTCFIIFSIRNGEKKLLEKSAIYILIFSILAAVLGLLKFTLSNTGELFIKSYGTSINPDQNFYALSLFMGVSILFFYYKKHKLVVFALLFLQISAVFLSGSRRGVFILLLIVLLSLIINLISLLKRKRGNYVFSVRALNISSFIVLFWMLLFVGMLNISGKRVYQTLKNMNIDPISYKINVEKITKRYSTILGDYYSTSLANLRLPFNALDPDTWSNYRYTSVSDFDSLFNSNIHKNIKGIEINRNSPAYKWNSEAVFINSIPDTISRSYPCVIASIYCFVSSDFNGDYVKLYEENSQGLSTSFYNIKKKGSWEKLTISYYNRVNSSIRIAVGKKEADDLSNLEGKVVFVYPQFEGCFPQPDDPVTCWGFSGVTIDDLPHPPDDLPKGTKGLLITNKTKSDTWGGDAYAYNSINSLLQSVEDVKFFNASVFCYVSEDYNGGSVRLIADGCGYKQSSYNLKKKGKWQRLRLTMECQDRIPGITLSVQKKNAKNMESMTGEVIFAGPHFYGPDSIVSNINRQKEEIKREKQSTLRKLKTWHKLFEGRTDRWQYAFTLFRDYNFVQKIFGNGFNYVSLYSKKYNKGFDYPHNPIASALLYSGFVGAIFYILFLIMTVYYYLKYFKTLYWLFYIYILVLFYTFFSGNSHFSVPVFMVFSVIPFITHALKTQTNEEYSDCRKEQFYR